MFCAKHNAFKEIAFLKYVVIFELFFKDEKAWLSNSNDFVLMIRFGLQISVKTIFKKGGHKAEKVILKLLLKFCPVKELIET